MLSERETVELFHLHFLRLLAAGRDKAKFVLKGGCNLRFFFGSVRYSEDLDLNAAGIPMGALKDRVDTLLASKVCRETLASAGIELSRVSTPKQTETTQRWKIELRVEGRDVPLNTKIEFSRRSEAGEALLESIEPRLVRHYRLMPILACHYGLATAIHQKVSALIGRREVQARDVFDLGVLFPRGGDAPGDFVDLRPKAQAAIDRVWEVPFSAYRGQVVAFLEPDHADSLGSREAWEAIQLQVVTALESVRGSP